MDARPTVLMIGPLPPPIGGQSVLVSNLLHSKVTTTYNYVVMDIAHHSPGIVMRSLLGAFFVSRLVLLLVFRPAIKLLHVHTSAGAAFFEKSLFVGLGKCFGKKVVLHIHGGRFREFWNQSGAWQRRLITRLLNLNDAIIVLSSSWSQFYEREVKCRCPIVVLPNAVAIQEIESRARNDSFTLLYVGQLRREKGLLDLAQALVLLSASSDLKFKLKIMGQGDNRKTERLIRGAYASHGLLNVEFLGALTGDEKWRQFSSADVFVLPSHGEDMPICVLEAMSMQLPVIATNVGAVAELVEDGVTGYVIQPHDAPALAKSIENLARKPALCMSMGMAGRKRSRELFSFERYEQRVEQLYSAVLQP